MLALKNRGSILLKVGLVLVIIAGGAIALYFNLQETVRVKAVGRDNAVDAITGSVTIHADGGMKDVKTEAGGKVIMTNLKPGSHFKKGDVLVQLDTKEMERDEKEAERLYEDARERMKLRKEANVDKKVALDKLETAKRLNRIGTVSEEDVNALQRVVDNIELNLKLAELDEKKFELDRKIAVERYNTQHEKMSVRAPFDGTIEGAMVVEGEIIGSGHTVAIIFSRKRVVAVKISEEDFGRIRVGQTARLRLLTYGSQNYDATVSELLPTADESQRFTVYLDVKVDPELLKPRSTGEATITVAQRPDALVIPRRALYNGTQVCVVKNGRVAVRKVDPGFIALNVVEIRGGLEQGEHVIVDSPEVYRHGQRVRIEVIE
jgi:RND family efflux transporter MFP subunit